jgi:hypothetical protein
LSCTAPNGLPAAPSVGIVPGTAVGDVVAGNVVGVAGARRVFVEQTWPTAVPLPNKTRANIGKSKRCIKASCTHTSKFCRCLVAARRGQPAMGRSLSTDLGYF